MSVTDFSSSYGRTFTQSRWRKSPPKSFSPANSAGRRASAAGPHTSSDVCPYMMTVNPSSVGARPTSCTRSSPRSQLMMDDFPEEWFPRKTMQGVPPPVTTGRLSL